jgi:hypothetical protein
MKIKRRTTYEFFMFLNFIEKLKYINILESMPIVCSFEKL